MFVGLWAAADSPQNMLIVPDCAWLQKSLSDSNRADLSGHVNNYFKKGEMST